MIERAKRSEMTLEEIKNKLVDYDTLTLLEILDIDTEDLLYYLSDVVVEKQRELEEFLDDADVYDDNDADAFLRMS